MDFSAIKAGDRVWVGNNGGTRTQGIKTVAIVTPTLIRIDWNGGGKYLPEFFRTAGVRRRAGYERAGVASWNPNKITGIATKAECAKWDAEQLAAKLAKEAKERADAAREMRRIILSGLFAGYACVNDELSGDREGFTLELHGLTETRIRERRGYPAKPTRILIPPFAHLEDRERAQPLRCIPALGKVDR